MQLVGTVMHARRGGFTPRVTWHNGFAAHVHDNRTGTGTGTGTGTHSLRSGSHHSTQTL